MKRQCYQIYIVVLGLLMLTSACTDEERDTICTTLIGGGRYCLQPSTAVAPFAVQQKVETHLRGTNETMIAELETDVTGMRFIGLTPFGQTLLRLKYDNLTISATNLPDTRLRPVLLLALMQLALWPADSLRVGLSASVRLEESAGQRRILNLGQPTLTINYTGDKMPYERIRISIHGADIELDITTLPENGTGQEKREQ